MSGYRRRCKGRMGGVDLIKHIIFMYKKSNNKKISEMELELFQSLVVGGVSVSGDFMLFF